MAQNISKNVYNTHTHTISKFIMKKSISVVTFALAILVARLLSSRVVAGYLYYPVVWEHAKEPPPSITSSTSSSVLVSNDPSSHSSIQLGELPGYTGWARPASTDAAFYEIEYMTPGPHFAHEEIVLIVRCDGDRCSTAVWAQFYVRMYGPAILTGRVTSINRGRYEIKFLPRDAGKYWMEVVLTFSMGEDFGNFPISKNSKGGARGRDPSYEGHLLPGFPRAVEISAGDGGGPIDDRRCEADDLRVLSINDGMRMATWRVVDKVNSMHHQKPKKKTIDMIGYQEGHNSLGIWADYQPINCNLIANTGSLRPLIKQCALDRLGGKPVHFVFIGDSVIRLQWDLLMHGTTSSLVKSTMISTRGGIIQTLQNVTSTLSELSTEGEEIVIIFNTGLHDISVFCSDKDNKRRPGYSVVSPKEFVCIEEYQENFTQLVEFLSSFPARVKVFQTTTAGWMKWGNYGFAWNPASAQVFSKSTHFVDALNHIAFRVFDDYDGFDIVDGYWVTLARPDNRQVDEYNSIGKHLVHPGMEVLRAMVRTWMTLVLSKLKC